MNKPAPKEPSMDEILSSIRQIIADDDAAAAPRRPSIQAAPPPMQAAPAKPLGGQADRDLSDMLDDMEPLALTPAQIVEEGDVVSGFSFDSILADTASDDDGPSLVEAEDVAFEVDDGLPSFDPLPTRALEPDPAPVSKPEPTMMALADVEPEPEPEPFAMPESFSAPEPEAFEAPEPDFEPEPVFAQASPLPDPTLTADMTEELLEPATRAAVRSSIGKLNALGIGNPGLTIEAMMRDMLRPMLKEWLDENLPSVVERMVEKELSRISRGE
jgi:cell pole-organizing protein PopZ